MNEDPLVAWRRKWQPTPVFLLGKSPGQKSQVGYSLWGCRVGREHASVLLWLRRELYLFKIFYCQFQVYSQVIQFFICIKCIYILFYILFHYKLLQDTKYSSLSYTGQVLVGYLFYIQQYVHFNPKFLMYPSPSSPLVIISMFSMSVSLFLFCK